MDITTVFGTVIGGSNPSESTKGTFVFALGGIRTGKGRKTGVFRVGRLGKTVGFPVVHIPTA